MNSTRRTIASIAGAGALVLTGLALGSPTAAGAASPRDPNITRHDHTGPAQLVKVHAASPQARGKVARLGLDVTESADARGIDVVLHGAKDADRLRKAGFTWTVKVRDLEAQMRRNAAADRSYAASVAKSPLPSGQDHYRTLEDYNREMRQLAADHPRLVRLFTLKNRSLEGRKVYGIELTRDVARTNDGKPVLLMMGAHHAREWPSSEHTIEFAYDLLKKYRHDGRATRIVDQSRSIFVPVVNVDGFAISRSAEPLGDFSLFDYEMKRKNCRVSVDTPPAYTSGTCEDNPAGRLRGTDPNRNYPGFWGGPGASTNWSDDTFRGDAPGAEPEVDSIRSLISQRQVTGLITNHTFSDLVLRPPSLYDTGYSPDEAQYKALGASMTDANGYANWAAFQLYDTSGSVEDWSYWNTGGYAFTFEIGDENFHPAYERAVVDEYLGLGDVAGAGRGGNREAYYRFATTNLDRAYHATITGEAPAKHRLTVHKQFTSKTSPIIVDDSDPSVTKDPIEYRDSLTSSLDATGGKFSWAVNPSTRPVIAGRSGRDPVAPPQPGFPLTNPPGVPAEGESEYTTFQIDGLPKYDNGRALVTVRWPGAPGDENHDWDVFLYNAAGDLVAQAATLANPEVAFLVDPVPGVYTVEVNNFQGNTAADDWSGQVSFESPKPQVVTGVKEAWMMTCAKKNGQVVSSRQVVVDRGKTVDVGNACKRSKPRR